MKLSFGRQGLTQAEALLRGALASGKPLDLAPGRLDGEPRASHDSPGRAIRATVLRRLLLSDAPAEAGALRQLDLAGAIITGQADLRFARIDFPLRFTDCAFLGPVLLTEASLRSVSLSRCSAPGIDARHVTVSGDLAIEAATLTGPLRLAGAHLADDLHLDATRLAAGEDGVALDLDDIDVQGKVDANRMTVRGEVRMESARVGGTLHLMSTVIDVARPEGDGMVTAWTGDGMVIEGEVDATGLRANAAVRLVACRVLDLVIRHARIQNDGPALLMDRLDARGTVCCDEGSRFIGGIRAVGVRVGSALCLRGATMVAGDGMDGAAVDLRHAEILQDLICTPDFATVGRLDLSGARVSGQACLSRADLRPAGGRDDRVLSAGRAEITEDLTAESLAAAGAMCLANATVRGSVVLRQREHPGDVVTLDASGLSVSHDVALDVAGTVALGGSQVTGDITIALSRLAAPRDAAAADLSFVKAGVLNLDGQPRQGLVDLTHAQAHLLCDDPRNSLQEATVLLDGFEYDKIAGLGDEALQGRRQQESSLEDRLTWLKAGTRRVRGPGGYAEVGFIPQPYQQLAAVYERAGLDRESRAVLHAMYRQRNTVKTSGGLSRTWNALQDITVGYGYAPGRALACLLALAVAAAGVFSLLDYPRLGLTRSIFLPIGLLLPGTGYKDLAPWDTGLGLLSHVLAAVLVLLGLILGATVLAALARRIRRLPGHSPRLTGKEGKER